MSKMLHEKTLTGKARAVADHANKLGTSATLGDMWREFVEELPEEVKKSDRFVDAAVTFDDWAWTGEQGASKNSLQFKFAKYAERLAAFVEGWEAADFEIHAANPQATHWDHTRRVGKSPPLIEFAESDDVTFERCSAELVTLVVRDHGRIPTRWGVCGCGILWGPFSVPREIRAEIRETLADLHTPAGG